MDFTINQHFSYEKWRRDRLYIPPLPDFIAMRTPANPNPVFMQKVERTLTPLNIANNLNDDELFRVAYMPFMVAEVVWDYADSIIACAKLANRELPEKDCVLLKRLSRKVRELRDAYQKQRAEFIDDAHRKVEERHMIEFQEQCEEYFKKLRYSVDNEMNRRYGKVQENCAILLTTTYVSQICFRSLIKYGQWADRLIEEKCGRASHGIIPNEILALGELLPQFAGDCAIDVTTPEMTLWRDTLCNLIHNTELNGFAVSRANLNDKSTQIINPTKPQKK